MRTETKIETHLGTITVIRCPDYVWAGFDDAPHCPLTVEAYPWQNEIGPIFFQGKNKNTLFHKREDESWEHLWSELDPGWDVVPWFKALAEAAFPRPMCDSCLGLVPLGSVQWGCTCAPERAEEVNALMRMED